MTLNREVFIALQGRWAGSLEDWVLSIYLFSPLLTVLDMRTCIILGAMEVFPFYRRYIKKQINKQKHPLSDNKRAYMENMIMFGTLGSGKQEGES